MYVRLCLHHSKTFEMRLVHRLGTYCRRNVVICLFFFCFFFSGALDPDLVVQWSVQWPSDITILNRAGVQWLCRATPEGGYTSTPKSPRNRTWPPGNVPRPNGAPKQSGVLGLLHGNGSHNAEQLHTAEPLPTTTLTNDIWLERLNLAVFCGVMVG